MACDVSAVCVPGFALIVEELWTDAQNASFMQKRVMKWRIQKYVQFQSSANTLWTGQISFAKVWGTHCQTAHCRGNWEQISKEGVRVSGVSFIAACALLAGLWSISRPIQTTLPHALHVLNAPPTISQSLEVWLAKTFKLKCKIVFQSI